jgi:hypothetical protein
VTFAKLCCVQDDGPVRERAATTPPWQKPSAPASTAAVNVLPNMTAPGAEPTPNPAALREIRDKIAKMEGMLHAAETELHGLRGTTGNLLAVLPQASVQPMDTEARARASPMVFLKTHKVTQASRSTALDSTQGNSQLRSHLQLALRGMLLCVHVVSDCVAHVSWSTSWCKL